MAVVCFIPLPDSRRLPLVALSSVSSVLRTGVQQEYVKPRVSNDIWKCRCGLPKRNSRSGLALLGYLPAVLM